MSLKRNKYLKCTEKEEDGGKGGGAYVVCANAAIGTGERYTEGANKTEKHVDAARVRGAASAVTGAVEVKADNK
jgi:hypothetical protein